VKDPSSPIVIEAVEKAMRAYENAPENEPKLTSPFEVQETIKGLLAVKAPGAKGVPNISEHLPKRAIIFITNVFNAVLRRQKFPPLREHARVKSILKTGKDPTLPFSYRSISILDTVGKLFEKILLTRFLSE
jgi:hypothetical protein